jgi:hypothetical protein
MTMASMNSSLLILWVTFSTLAVIGVTGILVWAVRSRQFANQERARFLPLQSPPLEPAGADRPAKAAGQPGNQSTSQQV